MVSRLACASAGTRKWQRATEFTHSSRMFLNRFPPIQTLQWIDPGAGANVIRATSSKGCAARGGLGATESTSMRTSPVALCADDGSVVAAANTTAVNAASQLIMRFRIRSNSRGRQSPRPSIGDAISQRGEPGRVSETLAVVPLPHHPLARVRWIRVSAGRLAARGQTWSPMHRLAWSEVALNCQRLQASRRRVRCVSDNGV